jgi:hypothetical protein
MFGASCWTFKKRAERQPREQPNREMGATTSGESGPEDKNI